MARFLVRRLFNYVALCLVATFLAFALAALTFNPIAKLQERNPPPPQSAIDAKRAELRFLAFTLAALTFNPVGRLMERNPPPPQSVIDAKRAELHLDEPIPTRFVVWLGGAVRGDFGQTTVNTSVSDELPRRIGVSLRLFLIGTVVGIALGVIVGVASAIRQYKFSDYFATLFSFVILTTPVFLLGLLLKYGALSVNTAAGAQLIVFTGETTPGFQGSFGAALLDRVQHLILPTISIALGLIAYYSRYQRSAMLDVLGSDFLRTAQAKGLTRRQALFKHGLRTALIPMATLFAFGFGAARRGRHVHRDDLRLARHGRVAGRRHPAGRHQRHGDRDPVHRRPHPDLRAGCPTCSTPCSTRGCGCADDVRNCMTTTDVSARRDARPCLGRRPRRPRSASPRTSRRGRLVMRRFRRNRLALASLLALALLFAVSLSAPLLRTVELRPVRLHRLPAAAVAQPLVRHHPDRRGRVRADDARAAEVADDRSAHRG